ncbi:arylsulfatase B-like [Ornithodoros turicata]|uniref:arylsulfatase B-like n=1 Tax=Ornithodoros turicata TaxID=34597 RepID=UPI00313884E9
MYQPRMLHYTSRTTILAARTMGMGTILLHALLLFAGCLQAVDSSKRPHVVIIVADDLGWDDVSFHGSEQLPTPNIDTLASDGLALHQYYVQATGTASRAALLTGQYPIHTGMQNGDIGNSEPWGLALNQKIMSEHFKDLGYATYAVGKWHLGFFRREYTPLMRGFDSHFGFWTSHTGYFDHSSYERYTQDGTSHSTWGLDLREDFRVVNDKAGHYGTDLFTEKAVEIIKRHNGSKPILLYLAQQAVHVGNSYHPLEAPATYVKNFHYIKDLKRRVFAGMVGALDNCVGQVFSALHAARMLEDSIVVFTTDNGGAAGGVDGSVGSNWPLRGTKGTLWEGGVRGVGILWTNKIVRGRMAAQLMHITDWLPTLYSAAGGDITDLGPIDGKDLWTALVDDRPSTRTEVLYNINYKYRLAALRVGKHKLVLGGSPDEQYEGWYETVDSKSTHPQMTSLNSRKALFTECGVYKTLWSFGRTSHLTLFDRSMVVECGPKPTETNSSCRPKVRPCIFDLERDPCEYRNIAGRERKLLARLFYRLQEIQGTGKGPLSKPPTSAADPSLHCNVWVSYMESQLTGMRHS